MPSGSVNYSSGRLPNTHGYALSYHYFKSNHANHLKKAIKFTKMMKIGGPQITLLAPDHPRRAHSSTLCLSSNTLLTSSVTKKREEGAERGGQKFNLVAPLVLDSLQNALWSALGVNIGLGQKFSPVQQVKDSDELFVIAYPHFNPREEMGAVFELYQQVAQPRGMPIIIFNGELDRLRGGYYPSLFFPELARLTNDFLPKFETAYYIHNFKGTKPGVLFRAYPGPWCVFRRNPQDSSDLRLIYTSDTAPSLKQVSLEILPGSK
ncbi:hypothetical protein DUNSADRAFT_1385 [Dunaliella salina]|uniref:DUF1995 domain-containing protein n=1 Tax=Dunaliella salina TaxID=3046 RepID=A0ABQ7FXJ2_DUNSA|nr:hypothetical protein DUNSADRAFT_1385 [Dunaliella salina]|eukprot:KAF5827075.1 hypothetical protein DUNSADRAFT_1385 [Dunaliella salina]